MIWLMIWAVGTAVALWPMMLDVHPRDPEGEGYIRLLIACCWPLAVALALFFRLRNLMEFGTPDYDNGARA